MQKRSPRLQFQCFCLLEKLKAGNLACCKDPRFRMDGSNLDLHLCLMAQGPFLWAGAHLANEYLVGHRRSCPASWSASPRSKPGRQRGPRRAHLQSCSRAPHSPGLLVYKNQRAEAETQVPTLGYKLGSSGPFSQPGSPTSQILPLLWGALVPAHVAALWCPL